MLTLHTECCSLLYYLAILCVVLTSDNLEEPRFSGLELAISVSIMWGWPGCFQLRSTLAGKRKGRSATSKDGALLHVTPPGAHSPVAMAGTPLTEGYRLSPPTASPIQVTTFIASSIVFPLSATASDLAMLSNTLGLSLQPRGEDKHRERLLDVDVNDGCNYLRHLGVPLSASSPEVDAPPIPHTYEEDRKRCDCGLYIASLLKLSLHISCRVGLHFVQLCCVCFSSSPPFSSLLAQPSQCPNELLLFTLPELRHVHPLL